jgi:hypothetical protein
MIQLSYISSIAHPMSSEDLLVLLQQCLTNNERAGVTGMLLYGNDTFLQVLEGEESVVDPLYEKIRRDPRHGNIKALKRTDIQSRHYPEWNMGFQRISNHGLADVSGLIDFSADKFTFDYLSEHTAVADRLMDHYSSWDPLVRKVEESERAIANLKKMLSHVRGCVEVATLVLDSIAEAGKAGSLGAEHLHLCHLALETLRQVPGLEEKARLAN